MKSCGKMHIFSNLTSVLLLTLFGQIIGYVNNPFKVCAAVDYCAQLRHQTVEQSSQFAADVAAIELNSNATLATVPLSNSEDQHLYLEINLLTKSRARVKVLELESEQVHPRYALVDVLDNEPEVVSLTVKDNGDNTATLTSEGLEYSVVIRSGPPFTVEFYLGDQLEVILNGDRLVMENTDAAQPFAFGVEFEGASKLYGLYHHAYKIALDETSDDSMDPFRLRNSDVWGYDANSPMALYGSIPVLYGHSASQTSGIFVHNAAEEWVDISYSGDRPSAYFMIEAGILDLFVFLGPTPKEVIRQYTDLTGVSHLPQLWALGYQQNRYTYWTQEEVKEVVAKLDAIDFPLDVIFLDDGHSNGNRYFEWNPENFTDPVELAQNISSTGRVMVSVSDPHIKADDTYPVYAGAKDKYFVRNLDGSDFHGSSWPGPSGFLDFLNPEAREYYGAWYSYDKFKGSTETLAGFWNDMNEPSIFDETTERTLPFNTVHFNGVLHRDVHNMYGYLHTKATHAGLMKRDNSTKRPFILSRSHFAGSQKYVATWTGDNIADWSFLAISYSECLTSNLLGLVFCGADVGGFFTDPTMELFQRWYQAAIWLPYFRGHSNKGTMRREPYLFSEDIQKVLRDAVKTRYRHIPVWYTIFYEHSRYGDPLIRPLMYDYPSYLEYDDHLLLGSDIMSRPVLASDVDTVEVTFPGESTNYWYRVDDDSWTVYEGGSVEAVSVDMSSAPYFYRGGSIITRKDVERPATSRMINDPYTLYVNLDSNGAAEGRLYVDDYTSFEYINSQSYLYIKYSYDPQVQAVQIEEIDGNSDGFAANISRIVVHSATPDEVISTVYTTTADGTPLDAIDVVKELKLRRGPFKLYL